MTLHILRKRDIFVTKDKKGFIGVRNEEKKEEYKKEFGIEIRLLDTTFIKDLKRN